MPRRVVVPRIAEGAAPLPASPSTRMFDPPALAGVRIAFGVGNPSGDAPDDDSFRATYVLSIPVTGLGGLDPDGVYEFDAGVLFEAIRKRALRRRWGARVEIELTQAADSVAHADVHVEGPSDECGLVVLGRSGRGTTLPGGARTIVVATAIVTDSKRFPTLSGAYRAQLRDTDPAGGERPNVASMVRNVHVDLTHFEFEG